MMISPEEFACKLEDKSYEELREVKDDLAAEIADFERRRMPLSDREFRLPEEPLVCPGPDVAYQMNLEYLSEVCKKLSEQFNREFEQQG